MRIPGELKVNRIRVFRGRTSRFVRKDIAQKVLDKVSVIDGNLKMSTLELDLSGQLEKSGIPCVREFRFHPVRRWRLDFAIVDQKIGIEVEGGIWCGGRHTRGAGFQADCEKYNALALLGWRLLRFTAKHIRNGEAIAAIRAAAGEAYIVQDVGQALKAVMG